MKTEDRFSIHASALKTAIIALSACVFKLLLHPDNSNKKLPIMNWSQLSKTTKSNLVVECRAEFEVQHLLIHNPSDFFG